LAGFTSGKLRAAGRFVYIGTGISTDLGRPPGSNGLQAFTVGS
jgi:hypothetical protein